MLPTNVMSFMKKMVAADDVSTTQSTPESTGTFGKLKQTLSSSLMTAQQVTKMSPRPSLVPDADASNDTQSLLQQQQQQQQQQQPQQQQDNTSFQQKQEQAKPPSRAGACRVCLKSFKPNDFSKTCFECQQRVCEDCASYSKLDDNEDVQTWRCSVCRRKMASRVCIQQDSTDSSLDVPVLEALVRRHSDVKLGSASTLAPNTGGGPSLAPPRTPELRRHSDVSPASLKELEKLKAGKGTSGDSEWRKGPSNAPSRSNSPPRQFDPPSRMGSRRPSRVARQHSYDDEVKNGAPTGSQTDLGLGIPIIPRRASAYDVFAPGILATAAQAAAQQGPPSRRPSFRVPPSSETPQNDDSPSPDNPNAMLLVDDDRRMRRRGSQLPDITALRDRATLASTTQLNPPPTFQAPTLEDLEAPRRQQSMDGEAIKIVIHDVDSGPICASKRRVVLRRDPTDKAHRTRGFGMRVVGGKTGADGRLFAYIVWTVPGGPAEKGGLQQGDKILEWNGVSLIDRSFEEVCAIMDRTGDMVDLLVEHATDFRMCDMFEDGLPPGGGGSQSGPRKSICDVAGLTGLAAEPDSTDKSPSSPTRRKLPKTPEQIAREKQVSGRVQLQVWYHGERNELVVSLMAADDLAPRDDSLGHGSQPEAYAKVKLLPKTHDNNFSQTEVSPPSHNPIWNATLTFPNINANSLMDRYCEIQLWDLVPHSDSLFLGECNVELQRAFLDDRAVWYRLEDPRGMRSGKSPNVSPRGSLVGVDGQRLMRKKSDYGIQRSISDETDSIGDGASLLHPDHAWMGGSRRGSSQSETLEVEVYQLGKDFSRSLPGSRRSSFQDQNKDKLKDGEELPTPPPSGYASRRRSSVARRDPDEILRSLKAVRGELGRAMSFSIADKRTTQSSSRRSSRSRKDSVMEIPELSIGIGKNLISPPSDDDIKTQKWKSSEYTAASTLNAKEPHVILGPGQIQPKGYRLTSERYGELKLGLTKIKGTVDVEVISARNIVPVDCETRPDTYVKCYVKDGDRLRHKKKTRVVRCSAEPIYKQTLKYQASDVFGRNLVIMVWQRCVGFEHNLGLGGAELSINKLNLSQHVTGWFPLFPMHTFGSDPNDSP